MHVPGARLNTRLWPDITRAGISFHSERNVVLFSLTCNVRHFAHEIIILSVKIVSISHLFAIKHFIMP